MISPRDAVLIDSGAAVVAAAADYLEVRPPNSPTGRLGPQLDWLRRRLEERMTASADADRRAEVAKHLVAVLRAQCELLDSDLVQRAQPLSEIRSALSGLRGLSPKEMIHAAPVVLSRELSFARAMISTVKGSLWMPQLLHIEGGANDPESRRFADFVKGAQFPLSSAPLETEIVRKRCGALVSEPATDKRTFKAIVERSGCYGYVAAPIIIQGRAIGMLHADRPGDSSAVAADHLEQLEAFAECLSVAFESAVLEEKAAQQRVQVVNLCATIDLQEVVRDDVVRQRGAYSPPDVASLTVREREIMEHVATGATNGQIARCLVISEGTVKSHLKHIAKKLNTPSRAAAVAVFSGLAGAGVPR